MPELPEVETIANDLNKELRNLKIIDFKVLNERTRRARPLLNVVCLRRSRNYHRRWRDPALINYRWRDESGTFEYSPSAEAFRKKLVGRTMHKVGRRAKMLVFDLGGNFVLIHLKMTGQLVLKGVGHGLVAGGHPIVGPANGGTGAGPAPQHAGPALPNKFSRAVFKFSDGSKLFFNDVRRFGWLKFLSRAGLDKEYRSLGVEPLTREFSLEKFKEILKRKKNTTIKQALFDQKYLAGIGNIYADESLFAARIKPQRKARSLKPAEIKKLWLSIRKILKLAIRHRGTSFSDYRDSRGQPGNFIKYLKVYGRAGSPCRVCGRPVKKSRLGGRGTHWCGHCQK